LCGAQALPWLGKPAAELLGRLLTLSLKSIIIHGLHSSSMATRLGTGDALGRVGKEVCTFMVFPPLIIFITHGIL
jgi:hypothetical protein